MSCTDWADKALPGEIGSIWVNKQPASSTKMPEIGFIWVTLQVIVLHLPDFRTREILSCTCLFWFSYLHCIRMGSSVSPFGEQCCKGKLAVVLRKRKKKICSKAGCMADLMPLYCCIVLNVSVINVFQVFKPRNHKLKYFHQRIILTKWNISALFCFDC